MENEMTETQVASKIERPKIKASCELWARFGEWMRVRGHQSLPEGLRAAMFQVTDFNPESQAQIT